MLTRLKKKAAAIALCGAVFSSSCLPVKADPTSQTRFVGQDLISSYQKAEQELSPSLYVIYQVVDRIARANRLDDRFWRFAIEDRPEINAEQSDRQGIRIFTGLLNQLGGDTSALACVIAHEMAHSVKHHHAIGLARKQELIEQLQQAAEAEVRQEAAISAAEISLAGALTYTVGSQRRQYLQQRLEEIKLKKTEELKQQLGEQRKQHEFEADEIGYLYSVKAGFEPEGCLRLMQMLELIPGTDIDSDTHPSVPRRTENIKALMRQYPPASLAAEGKARMDATQPITYELSQDGMSFQLIWNSEFKTRDSSQNSEFSRSE